MAKITYKLADDSDIDALIAVGDDLFDHPIKKNRSIEFLNDARHHLYLAYDGKNIVGMASAFHYVHPDKDPAMFINEVGVVDDYQNQGIGRTLVKRMVAHGRKLDCRDIWVATEHSNLAARKSYIAAGATESEEPVVLLEFKRSE